VNSKEENSEDFVLITSKNSASGKERQFDYIYSHGTKYCKTKCKYSKYSRSAVSKTRHTRGGSSWATY